MLFFPGSKLNLGLRIGKVREDGYHSIESVFLPCPVSDILEVKPGGADFSFMESGIGIPADLKDNLCYKAWKVFNDKYLIGGVSVHLHKIVPIGAGMGGGSADGTAMLKALRWLFKLDIADVEMEEMALQLGSDCPFFVRSEISRVSGRGEKLQSHSLNLIDHYFLIVWPELHITTREAFADLDESGINSEESFIPLLENSKEWQEKLTNDFEAGSFKKNPVLKEIKNALYSGGALYASMTGSGSAIYGIFKDYPKLKLSYKTFAGKL